MLYEVITKKVRISCKQAREESHVVGVVGDHEEVEGPGESDPTGRGRFDLVAARELVGVLGPQSRITSYNVCYTKLLRIWGQDRLVMQVSDVIHGVMGVIFVTASFGHIYMGTVGAEGAFEGIWRNNFV